MTEISIHDVTGKLVIDYNAAGHWCRRPYQNHPTGCPNHGHKATCPPEAMSLHRFIDINAKCWFVVAKFNLHEHMEKMRKKCPTWSDRQLRCILYWQGAVRKVLREATMDLVSKLNSEGVSVVHTPCPEAMGLYVIATGQAIGLPITLVPVDTVYKIALVGHSSQ